MYRHLLLAAFSTLLLFQSTFGQERPAYHVSTVKVAPQDENAFAKHLQRLVEVSERGALSGESMFASYRSDNEWVFITLRPHDSLVGTAEPVILAALEDTTAKQSYRNATSAIRGLDLRVYREVIQQVDEWSYVAEGAPEHRQHAIVQEWHLKAGSEGIDGMMEDLVEWAQEMGYPYSFDTYYTVEQPWTITFVTWVDSLDEYFETYAIMTLETADSGTVDFHDRLRPLLVDYETSVKHITPGYSYLPR